MLKSLLFTSLLAFTASSPMFYENEAPFKQAQEIETIEVYDYLTIGKLTQTDAEFPYINTTAKVESGLDIGTSDYSVYVQVSNYKYLNANNASTQNPSIVWLNILIGSSSEMGILGYQVPLRGPIMEWVAQSEFKRLISFEIELARYQTTTAFGVSYSYKYLSKSFGNVETITDSHIFGGSNITDNWNASYSFENGFNSLAKFSKPKSFSIDNTAYIDAYEQDAYNMGFSAGKTAGYVDGYNDGENGGYDIGYDDGYGLGFNDGQNSDFNSYSWITGIFSAMGAFLSIQLLPNVTIGGVVILIMVLTLLPFLIGLLKGGKG